MYRILVCLLIIGASEMYAHAQCGTTSYILSGFDGTDETGTMITDGNMDLQWQIIADPDPGQVVPYFPKVSDIDESVWTGVTGTSITMGSTTFADTDLKMIVPVSEATQEHAGVYVYETTFCISHYTTEVEMNLQVLADNRADVYLNGNLVASHDWLTGSGFAYNNGHEILINETITNQSYFNIGGTNTIQVRVTNYDSSFDTQTRMGLFFFSEISCASGCVDYSCSETPWYCETCQSFTPVPGDDYWISAWVNVQTPTQVKTYDTGILSPSLGIEFTGSLTSGIVFYPTGDIIDGWQRIVGKFEVPLSAADIELTLNANASYPTYFDDIRIHPFNASMKSYVYDGETFWLVSELDNNNYATFYEYDEEGGLIRIKKETARGIVTIQETRSNTVKQ